MLEEAHETCRILCARYDCVLETAHARLVLMTRIGQYGGSTSTNYIQRILTCLLVCARMSPVVSMVMIIPAYIHSSRAEAPAQASPAPEGTPSSHTRDVCGLRWNCGRL